MFEILVIYRWASLGGVERMLLNRAHAFKEHGRDVRLNVLFMEDIGGVKALNDYARARGVESHFRVVDNLPSVSPDLTISIDTPEALSMIPADWPLVMECHTHYPENRRYLSDLGPSARALRGIWAPSTTFKALIEKDYPQLPCDIRVVSNCLAPPGPDLPDETHRYPGIPVLYLGRTDTLKNVVDVVRIVKRARLISGLDLRLLIIGDVYDEGLMPAVEQAGMMEFVAVLPPIGFEETSRVYRQVHRQGGAFVSASGGESFGLAAAEAMMHGLPLLLSDIAGHRTLVHGNERLLFPSGDVEDAAQKLRWIIQDGWRAVSSWGEVCADAFSTAAFIADWDRATTAAGFPAAVVRIERRPPALPKPRILRLWSVIEEQLREIGTIAAESRTLMAKNNEATVERDAATAERNAAIAERDAATIRLSQNAKLLGDITASYSWRMTAPVRFAIRLARHGLLAEDRRWIEHRVRRAFHRLPLSPNRKEALFHWYGGHFGYPLPEPDRATTRESTYDGATAREFPAEGAAAGEFLAPEHWSHHATPYGVLCLPIIDWAFRFQRPQQLARRFAAKGHPVLYAGHRFGAVLAAEPLETGITGLTLPGNERANVYKDMPTDAEVDRMVDALLDHMASGPQLPWVCVVQLPFWGPVGERLRQRAGCPLIYDCMDDHSGFSTNGEAMLAAEDRLLHDADLVIASSLLLHDKAHAKARRTALIRNAVDYEHFAAVPETHHVTNGNLTVGYYGAIADWFDSGMLAAMARSRPDWRFVLIGSTFSADTAPLTTCPNVLLTGEKPYAELPALIEDWDCCVIPFRRLPLTEATNPVKVYEMLAAGKPIVAVRLPELLPIAQAGNIALADTAEEFVREIEQEVARNDDARQAARRRYASENTWQLRQEALDLAIRELYPLVSVIIVTYNNLALNQLCLDSVFNDTDYPNFEVIVVDNASADGTPAYLKALAYPRLKVILNQDNRGFSAANNQGLALASGQYVCLLNNDTIVTGAWLSTLVSHLKANPELGLVGPVTNAIDNEARIPVGYRDLLDMPAWAGGHCQRHRGQLEDIPMLAFFCVAMPRAVFEKVGPLDERFGIGMFEDDDYNRRVREAGLTVKLARDAYIHHWQKSSFKLIGEDAYLKIYYENQKKYRAKCAIDSITGTNASKIAGMVEASRHAPGTVIFAPSVGWNIHLFQRPHHLARVLAQDGYVVVFDCSNSYDDVDLIREIEPRLFLFKGEPELLWTLEKSTLWTFTYNYDYRDRFPADTPVIYDWIDDLTVFHHDQVVLGKLHARAMKEADVVASVARKLHQEALRERQDAIYLPNAVEEGRFDRSPTPNPALADKAFARLVSSRKPIAGYYGALARWFDYELLARTAELRPDWNFVLIGPDYDGSIGRSDLSRHDNITWLGPRDYQSLPGYLHLFDVAMIPFRINDITLATSPLKLFEYFAAGRPVVTTPMPECTAFSEIHVASTAEEFASALDAARSAAKNPQFRARLATLASENTWRARTRAALAGLDGNDEEPSAAVRDVMTRFRNLEHRGNRHFFRALAKHLSSIADDPCLPMYFKFALSANERGEAVAELLAKHVEIAGKQHLDVGCAYGGFVVAFSKRGADSRGFDIDPAWLQLGKANFRDARSEFTTYCLDVTQSQDIADFKGRFDIITCNDVIEHVSDPATALRNMSQMLSPGGIAYLEIPNRDAASSVLRDGHYQLFGITQLDREHAAVYYSAHAPGVPYGVEHYLSLPEYRALLDAAGLEMELLEESLVGIDVQYTLDAIRQIEQSMTESLREVPAGMRDRVGEEVTAYLTRAKAATTQTEQEKTDFLLTYGTPFWKIVARKKATPASSPALYRLGCA
jgi:GT2 family glycosyltransferase/2-polyprenyl-3-methyl-5-hydroxy-6-metoxy-1,4-benzoquinol methylase